MEIKFKKLNDKAIIPSQGSKFSAGSDLRALLNENITIEPGKTVLIPTGLAIEIPSGFFGMVAPRSGLALNHGITVLNAPGIVDSDYRGELKCIIINHSNAPFIVENEMRIAQIVICPYQNVKWLETQVLEDSSRNIGGFGSTGLK